MLALNAPDPRDLHHHRSVVRVAEVEWTGVSGRGKLSVGSVFSPGFKIYSSKYKNIQHNTEKIRNKPPNLKFHFLF